VKKFVIEREIPKIGSLKPEQMKAAAAKSNEVLRQLGPDVQWLETFVTADKTFCIYLAKDESIIRQHAELSGLPANRISEIAEMIDPATGAE
jgi:Nickel responsive protein SCO4226-like